LYLLHRLNLIRGKREIPDPCKIGLGKCLRVNSQGERKGYVETLNKTGERIERIFKLNSDNAVAYRAKWLDILRSMALYDEAAFRQLIGFPSDLYDLRRKQCPENTRKAGLKKSAHFLLTSGELPEWY
jgi:hypothetical protein